MGEAMLHQGLALPDGQVEVGPLRLRPRHPSPPGPVKVAIRPEAWAAGAPGANTLNGTLTKQAYLGSHQELTVDTPLGDIFVISANVQQAWQVGDAVGLSLDGHGLCVVGP